MHEKDFNFIPLYLLFKTSKSKQKIAMASSSPVTICIICLCMFALKYEL